MGVIKTSCLLMLSWIFTGEFWLRIGLKAVITQCKKHPVVLMRFFTDERCEHHYNVRLFFYQCLSVYLTTEVISKAAVKQCVPLDTSHYLQVALQAHWLLAFRFFHVIYSPSAENLVIQRPIIEIYPVIEEILALLSGNSFGVAYQEWNYRIYPYLIQSCCTGSVYWIFSWSGKISNYKKCANMQVWQLSHF